MQAEVARLQDEAKTAMLVAVDGEVHGVIGVVHIRRRFRRSHQALHQMGLKVCMITGDNQKTAGRLPEGGR
jgi:Cu+-exporting ATPase